jgi:hypothetical protein
MKITRLRTWLLLAGLTALPVSMGTVIGRMFRYVFVATERVRRLRALGHGDAVEAGGVMRRTRGRQAPLRPPQLLDVQGTSIEQAR